MSARTRTRFTPVRPGATEIRLPWWAVVLPAVAFAALLLVILNPADAGAAAGDPVLGEVLDHARHLLLRWVP